MRLDIMKKIIISCIFILNIIFLCSCGHTMYHKVQGTGIYGRIPLPNGSSLIEVAIGDMNITSGILRGGATLDQNTSKGGTFGSVSIGRHTTLTTVPAVNEGNIRDILTSPNTDDKTKQMIAQYLITRQQLPPPASAVTSVNAGSATGDKSSVPVAKPTKTGMDNVVDKVAQTTQEVIPEIIPPVTDAAKDITKSVATATENSVKNVSDASTSWISDFKWTIIIIGIILILVLSLGIYFFIRFKRKSKIQQVIETTKQITE